MNATPSTAEILRQFLPSYRQRHSLTPQQAKVTGLLCRCRTEALGGYDLACDQCDYHETRFRSCRNRHCPQCQQHASATWLAERREDLLPVPYFHLVFTVPHQLNPWVQLHPEVLYAVLFKAVWHTLRSFGDDPKRLDGQIGMTAVLHTWGQNLSQHVHLHCLIPGGGYHRERDEWHPARSTYLFPVKALSRRYRGRMVSELRQAYDEGLLSRLTDVAEVECKLASLMETPWVVYARSTCQHSDTVLAYLARYTHRIAISNNRLEMVGENDVIFRYKDYASGGTSKRMRLQGEEFVRRLLLHVLPHGLMRIRHYGFMANCCRRKRLEQIRHCLEVDTIKGVDTVVLKREGTVYPAMDLRAITTCPRCHQGSLQVVGEIETGRPRRCCDAVM